MHIVRQRPEVPVTDPSLALLVRFLDQHPELQVLPKAPGVHEMFNLVNEIEETGQRRFAVLFGSEASATYRWMRAGSRQTPAVSRLMYYLHRALTTAPQKKRVTILKEWGDTVLLEGAARGEANVFKSGTWNLDYMKEVAAKAEANQNAADLPLRKKGLAAKRAKEAAAAE
jgi:hypothetical protein